MSRFAGRRKAPKDFDFVQPVLDALDEELRTIMADHSAGQKKNESLWPVHQINWQKSRYIYDLYYKYERIPREVYQYCIDNKLVDGALMAKWKKPGYERLCSTFVINPRNYQFGTTSVCRVPRSQLPEKSSARDHTTGCRGCASGEGEGFENIFGNKYGQRLAKVQVMREELAREAAEKVEADENILEDKEKYVVDEEESNNVVKDSTSGKKRTADGEGVGEDGDSDEVASPRASKKVRS